MICFKVKLLVWSQSREILVSISIIVHGPSSGEDASSCLARAEGSPEISGDGLHLQAQ